eukprot:7395566-Pyramimonas_sp.AAC.1
MTRDVESTRTRGADFGVADPEVADPGAAADAADPEAAAAAGLAAIGVRAGAAEELATAPALAEAEDGDAGAV